MLCPKYQDRVNRQEIAAQVLKLYIQNRFSLPLEKHENTSNKCSKNKKNEERKRECFLLLLKYNNKTLKLKPYFVSLKP